MRQNQTNFQDVVLSYFFFSQVFQVTVFKFFALGSYYACLFLLLLLRSHKSVYILRSDLRFLLCFFLVPVYGIVVMPLNSIVYGTDYISFIPATAGRMVNTCTNIMMFFLITSYLNSKHCNFDMMIRAYITGCMVLVVFGLWQLCHDLFGVPYPNFQTRSHLHSMVSTRLNVTGRVTSIAEEPSYLVPYLIEPFILIHFSKYRLKNIWLPAIAITLVFTVSLSAYMNVCILLSYIFVVSRRTKKKALLFCLAVISFVVLFHSISPLLIQVFSRMKLSSLLQGERLQEIYVPLVQQFKDLNYWGYGPKGYNFVAGCVEYVAGWRAGEIIADSNTTSHILFVDFLLEYGVLGLVLLIFLFLPLLRKTFVMYRFHDCKVPHILLINYLISNMFVVDYASPHCLIVFAILMYYLKKSNPKIIAQNLVE